MPLLKESPGAATEINTLLGQGSSFEGKLTFEGAVRIDGQFKGDIFTDGTLVIGESAEVQAEIEVGTVVIQGAVQGNIRATEAVEAHAPARIRGNIMTPTLCIDRGVVFDGNCQMEGQAEGRAVSASASYGPPALPARPAVQQNLPK